MSIRNRIILLILLLIALLAFTGIFTYCKFTEVTNKLSEIGRENIELSNKVVALNLLHLEHTELFKKVVEEGLLLQTDTGRKKQFSQAKQAYNGVCMAFDQGVHNQDTLLNDPQQFLFLKTGERQSMKLNLDSIKTLHNICAPSANKVFNLLEFGNVHTALPIADSFYENEKKINSQLTGLLGSYNQYAERAIKLSQVRQGNILLDLILIIAVVAIFGIVGALLLSRGILQSLSKAVWFAHQVKEGNREVSFDNIPRDEIGELLQTLREMLMALRRSEQIILDEKKKSDDLLLNILPAEVAEELKEKGSALARHFDEVTVLFTDFKDFTLLAEQLSPQELVDELDACFKEFDAIMARYHVEKIKTVGDAYLAAAGLPLAQPDHAFRVLKASLEIVNFMKVRKANLGNRTFEIRLGIHSGSVVAGIVGVRKFAYDIWGDTVNTAARMEQHSEAGKINISQATYDLVKDKFSCTYRGELPAKNKGVLNMYFVEREL